MITSPPPLLFPPQVAFAKFMYGMLNEERERVREERERNREERDRPRHNREDNLINHVLDLKWD